MRGDDEICGSYFSYIHPLWRNWQILNTARGLLSGEFGKLCSAIGRVSIPPERVFASLLQAFYSIRSERQFAWIARRGGAVTA